MNSSSINFGPGELSSARQPEVRVLQDVAQREQADEPLALLRSISSR